MSMKVENMKWEDMKGLVERRLNRLAMCKRGTLQTDINKLKEALGKRPVYTSEERLEIDKALAPKIKKALTPTAADMKLFGEYGLSQVQQEATKRANKIMKNRYDHPDEPNWKKSMQLIEQQEKERNAQLDGDFQEIMDQFLIGEIEIKEFIEIYADMEAREW